MLETLTTITQADAPMPNRAADERAPLLPRSVRFAAAFLLAIYGAAFLTICAAHLLWPGFTEPMEGDVLQHVERIAHGQSPYVAPSGDFIPLSYMPLYYVVAAPLYRLFGDSFLGPRLVSVVCALISCALVVWIAWRESRDPAIGLLAGTFFCAGYKVMDGYLTCALPDTLLLACLLAAFAFFTYGKRPVHDIAWLVFMSLAFWIKQQGAIFFAGMVAYALIYRRNHIPRWAIVAGLLVGCVGTYVAASFVLGDWFTYYTFVLPGRWEHKLAYSARRVVFLIAVFVPVATLLTWPYAQKEISGRRVPPIVALLVITLASAAFTMTAAGSSNNHFVPFVAVLSITAALGAGVLWREPPPRGFAVLLVVMCLTAAAVLSASGRTYGWHRVPWHVMPIMLALGPVGLLVLRTARSSVLHRHYFAALIVFTLLGTWFYDVRRHLPRESSRDAIVRLRADLSRLGGETIWITYGNVPSAFTGRKLGRAPSWVAIEDLARQNDSNGSSTLMLDSVRRRLARVDHILSDTRLDELSSWGEIREEFTLEHDYRDTFAAIPQIAYHWYSGGSYPRFLYQRERLALGARAP